nr:uncharacterized protein LOC4352245 isoform X2 [Oryza sativa Japonica Group]
MGLSHSKIRWMKKARGARLSGNARIDLRLHPRVQNPWMGSPPSLLSSSSFVPNQWKARVPPTRDWRALLVAPSSPAGGPVVRQHPLFRWSSSLSFARRHRFLPLVHSLRQAVWSLLRPSLSSTLSVELSGKCDNGKTCEIKCRYTKVDEFEAICTKACKQNIAETDGLVLYAVTNLFIKLVTCKKLAMSTYICMFVLNCQMYQCRQ